MKTGWALVSVLDEDGAPCIVQHTKILPPKSSMEIAPESTRENAWKSDLLYGKYEKDFDPDSAYEDLESVRQAEAAAQEAEKQRIADEKQAAKEAAAAEKAAQKEAEREAREKERLKKKIMSKAENEIMNFGIRSAKKFLKNLLSK